MPPFALVIHACPSAGRRPGAVPVAALAYAAAMLLGAAAAGCGGTAGPERGPAWAPPESGTVPAPAAGDSLPPLAVRWRVEVGAPPLSASVGADGAHAYLATAGAVRAYDLATGAPRWSAAGPSSRPDILVSDGRLVVAASGVTNAGEVVALDAASGAVRWRAAPPDYVGAAAPLLDGARVYVGTSGPAGNRAGPTASTVLAYDRETGALRWSASVGAGWAFRSGVRGFALADSTLYVSATQCVIGPCGQVVSWVIALDAGSGREQWRLRVGEPTGQTMLIRAVRPYKGLLLASDAGSNAALAIDVAARRVAWRTAFRATGFGPADAPAVDAAGIAYVGSADEYVYALDPATGRKRWGTYVGGSVYELARCERGVVAQLMGLRPVRTADGRAGRLTYSDASEFAKTNLAVAGDVVVAGTSRGLVAVGCPE